MADTTLIHETHEFRRKLKDVERDSHTLRTAMMKRQPDVIWDAIADQEKSLTELQQFYKDMGFDQPGHSNKQLTKELLAGEGVCEMITRTQSLLSTNKRLASTFLDVVDRSLSKITTGGKGAGTYGANGKMGGSTLPCFVQQQV